VRWQELVLTPKFSHNLPCHMLLSSTAPRGFPKNKWKNENEKLLARAQLTTQLIILKCNGANGICQSLTLNMGPYMQ